VGKAHNIEAKLKAREEQPNPTLEQKCAKREIRVWFSSDVADDMPWSFKPTQDYVTVRPGESTLAFFTAHNKRCATCNAGSIGSGNTASGAVVFLSAPAAGGIHS
jgi:cytochrome c oxidase assembly protein Cox11